MMYEDRAKYLLDKYGDDLYRFAFILTCSGETAGRILADAFERAAGNISFAETDGADKKLLLSLIYKNAAGCKDLQPYDAEKYGKKSETFMKLVGLPLKERAVRHLVLYEDMTDNEAEEVIKG